MCRAWADPIEDEQAFDAEPRTFAAISKCVVSASYSLNAQHGSPHCIFIEFYAWSFCVDRLEEVWFDLILVVVHVQFWRSIAAFREALFRSVGCSDFASFMFKDASILHY